MLEDKKFKMVVDWAPLISIHILIKKLINLGRVVFAIGGKINKNEIIDNALS